MIKLSFCLHRRPDLTREEFQRTWREDHAPLVKAAASHLGIVRYVQSHTFDHPIIAPSTAARGIPHGDGEAFDGVAELWFEHETFDAAPTEEGARHSRILAEDEARFIDFSRSRMFMVRENVVVE
ncbi:EthD domain-containing protein [Qipengyuania zhejiangensis]|uniref:EthD domain-containing protein n=1 Tax=Qipengyuania zhejiangensis TaxID=3077782 RepID=UPI002D7973FB|nr:EthD domain-containing protein [Qipengyuania sp. Z2]